MGKGATALAEVLYEAMRGRVPVQTKWAVAKSVDWDERTMTASGLDDDLEFYDVNLGLNSTAYRPAIDSKCLLGLMENNNAAAFLIWCEDVEEIAMRTEDCELVMNENGFKLKKGTDSLQKLMAEFLDEMIKVKVVQGVTPNVLKLTDIQTRFNDLLNND